MHAIEHTYVSLLADAARLTGFSEIRGSYEGLHWCLNEAPKLEKQLMKAVEQGESLVLDDWPEWLHRLALGSVEDPMLMRIVRQLLLFSYKAYVQHDRSTTTAAFSSFFNTNSEVAAFSASFSTRSPRLLDRVRKHVQSVLYRFREGNIVPFHGPGAVTTSKDAWLHWYDTIDYVYPYSDYMCLYFNRDAIAELDDCERPDHITAKLISVPKDTRGPRLICVHPAEAIWIQQGVRVELERAISANRYSYGPWPRGHIRFNDQTVNGRIALLSSRSRRYATIDMKEASDRISDVLIQALFGRKYKYFGCCRAQKYVVAEKGVTTPLDDNLHSYAPMGNATTFPVESLVFWAICCASMQSHGFHQSGSAFVFGDDIIIPSEAVEFVIDDLESFGLVVNRSKSFWRGPFRESCGVDAFNGVNVTPLRWKTGFDAESLSDLLALSDLAMRLRVAGYDDAALTAYGILRKRMKRRFSVDVCYTNNIHHGGIAEYVNDSRVWNDAVWRRSQQWFHTPVYSFRQPVHKHVLGGWIHVLESISSLTRNGASSVPDRDVSRRLRLDRGWIPVL